jgi:hypothetical protein
MRNILILSVSLLAFAACGKSEQTITVKDSDGKDVQAVVGKDGDTTTIKTEQGEIKIAQSSQANFPSYAPQYPGSKVTTTMTASGKGDGMSAGMGNMIAMETSDAPAAVMAFYKASLTSANMPIKMETTTPQGGIIAAGAKEMGGGVMITVGESDGKTSIAIISGRGK